MPRMIAELEADPDSGGQYEAIYGKHAAVGTRARAAAHAPPDSTSHGRSACGPPTTPVSGY
jgi:hypothetical protein